MGIPTDNQSKVNGIPIYELNKNNIKIFLNHSFLILSVKRSLKVKYWIINQFDIKNSV